MEPEEIQRPPRFSSEAEEADWWAANPDFILREFQKAKTEGGLGYGTGTRLAAERRAASLRTLELDQADIEVANKLAERKGIERSAYLKDLLHSALLKEEESMNSSSAA